MKNACALVMALVGVAYLGVVRAGPGHDYCPDPRAIIAVPAAIGSVTDNARVDAVLGDMIKHAAIPGVHGVVFRDIRYGSRRAIVFRVDTHVTSIAHAVQGIKAALLARHVRVYSAEGSYRLRAARPQDPYLCDVDPAAHRDEKNQCCSHDNLGVETCSTDHRGQWALDQVAAPQAWTRLQALPGLPPVTVAVIDSGIATHPDLARNMWSGTKPDVHGRNFATLGTGPSGGPDNTEETQGHGTMVAGIIAAESNNNKGIAGVTYDGDSPQNPRVQLMAVKIMSDKLESCTDDLIAGLQYVVDPLGSGTGDASEPGSTPDANRVTVVNLSSSYTDASAVLRDDMGYLASTHPELLFVVAVSDHRYGSPGPHWKISDADPDYPTSYKLPNVLTVTASTMDDCRVYAYGADVDIAAPGDEIISTIPQGIAGSTKNLSDGYDERSGTSFAAPLVAGTAALLRSLAPPAWTATDIREYLLRSANDSHCDGGPRQADYEKTCKPSTTAKVSGSLCSSVVTQGLLDVNAATSAPIEAGSLQVKPVAPATRILPNQPAQITWHKHQAHSRSSGSSLCSVVELGTTADNGASFMPLVLQPASAGTNLADEAAVAILPGNLNPGMKVILRCPGSQLISLSDPLAP